MTPGTALALEDLRRSVAPHRLARERLLPVLPAVAPLLPDDGLPRGATVVVRPAEGGRVGGGGATALALALVAGATASGAWCGVVALPGLGYLAAAELGVSLARLVVLDPPGGSARVLERAAAASIDAFDVVLVAASAVGAGAASRLSARARTRGAALVVLEGSRAAGTGQGSRPWPGPAELVLSVGSSGWEGLGEGHGRLGARRLEATTSGRGAAARPHRAVLLLPGAGGAVASEGVQRSP